VGEKAAGILRGGFRLGAVAERSVSFSTLVVGICLESQSQLYDVDSMSVVCSCQVRLFVWVFGLASWLGGRRASASLQGKARTADGKVWMCKEGRSTTANRFDTKLRLWVESGGIGEQKRLGEGG
jgi:hypothetical protein